MDHEQARRESKEPGLAATCALILRRLRGPVAHCSVTLHCVVTLHCDSLTKAAHAIRRSFASIATEYSSDGRIRGAALAGRGGMAKSRCGLLPRTALIHDLTLTPSPP